METRHYQRGLLKLVPTLSSVCGNPVGSSVAAFSVILYSMAYLHNNTSQVACVHNLIFVGTSPPKLSQGLVSDYRVGVSFPGPHLGIPALDDGPAVPEALAAEGRCQARQH